MEGGVADQQDQIRKQQAASDGNHLKKHAADFKRKGGHLNQWAFTVC